MMEQKEKEKKPKATRKEIMMVIIVVVLAFGLTVAGIVYLTNFLIGGSDIPSDPVAIEQPSLPESTPDVVVFDGDTPLDPATTSNAATSTPTAASATDPQVATPAPATTPTPAAPAPQVAVATPPPAVTPAPAVRTPTSGVGTHVLQLFAFRSEATAQTEANKYIVDCPDIRVVRVDLGADGVWYRVRGCTGSQAELAAKKTDLEKRYSITPYIVKVQ